ncbi:hypothetical protein FRB93_001688 [Tulasnella sp. JGI-2019a]|nr:hypothetical protein FRB93_001688 [Tulasnella sp. JGI-2019a]
MFVLFSISTRAIPYLIQRSPPSSCADLSKTTVGFVSQGDIHSFLENGDTRYDQPTLPYGPYDAHQKIPLTFKLLGGDADGCAYGMYDPESDSESPELVAKMRMSGQHDQEGWKMELRVLNALYPEQVHLFVAEYQIKNTVHQYETVGMPFIPGEELIETATWDEEVGVRPSSTIRASSAGALDQWKGRCQKTLSDVQGMITDVIMSYAAEYGFMHCDPHSGNVIFKNYWEKESLEDGVKLIDWARSRDVHGLEWAFRPDGDQVTDASFAPVSCLAEADDGYGNEQWVTTDPGLGPYSAQRQQVLAEVKLRFPVSEHTDYSDAMCT